jgi:hypothetical protein
MILTGFRHSFHSVALKSNTDQDSWSHIEPKFDDDHLSYTTEVGVISKYVA